MAELFLLSNYLEIILIETVFWLNEEHPKLAAIHVLCALAFSAL